MCRNKAEPLCKWKSWKVNNSGESRVLGQGGRGPDSLPRCATACHPMGVRAYSPPDQSLWLAERSPYTSADWEKGWILTQKHPCNLPCWHHQLVRPPQTRQDGRQAGMRMMGYCFPRLHLLPQVHFGSPSGLVTTPRASARPCVTPKG